MSNSIENILATPNKKKETEYNIITTMSKDINKWYWSLINTINGWWNKEKNITKKEIIQNNQITNVGEEREKSRSEKRK